MKKYLAFLGMLLFVSGISFAQTTTVTATVTDSDNITWFDGTVTVQFVPNPAQPNLSVYRLNGAPLSMAVVNQRPISLGSEGTFSVSVYDNTQVTPAGSSWQYTICPFSTSKCGILVLPASGPSMNISSQVTATIPVPRFSAVIGNYGYADVEAILQLVPGNIYYNVTDSCYRGYSGSAWGCVTGNTLTTPITIANGGTGATTAPVALANLGGVSSFLPLDQHITSLDSVVAAVPGTGTITAAYAQLVTNGYPTGEIFLPCGTYLDNFQPSTGVEVEGAAKSCVTVEPLDTTKPALGRRILSYVTGYSVGSGGVVTFTSNNNFIGGGTQFIAFTGPFLTSPASSCMKLFATTGYVGYYIRTATATQFTITEPACSTPYALQSDTVQAATVINDFAIKDLTVNSPGTGTNDAIELQSRVDMDWIADRDDIENINIQGSFVNGIHVVGRCIICKYTDIYESSDSNDGFLSNTSTTGCTGTTATCNGTSNTIHDSAWERDSFNNNGNYGVGLIAGSTYGGSMALKFDQMDIEGNGAGIATNCAGIYLQNQAAVTIKLGYFEGNCPSGVTNADIRATGLYATNFNVNDNIFNDSTTIYSIYDDAGQSTGEISGNRTPNIYINSLSNQSNIHIGSNFSQQVTIIDASGNEGDNPVSTTAPTGETSTFVDVITGGILPLQPNNRDIIRLYDVQAGTPITTITGGYDGRLLKIYSAQYGPSVLQTGGASPNGIKLMGGATSEAIPTNEFVTLSYSAYDNAWHEIASSSNRAGTTNGVTLTTGGSATTYLNGAGAYTAPAVTGTVGIANGGTGATTAATALANLGGAPLVAPTFTGIVKGPIWTGTGSVTFAVQSGAGTGATAVCQSSNVCNQSGGTVLFTTGTSPTGSTGTAMVYVVDGGTNRPNFANCTITGNSIGTGIYQWLSGGSSSTALLNAQLVTAPPASTAMVFAYTCTD
jgi:hypothetical protein